MLRVLDDWHLNSRATELRWPYPFFRSWMASKELGAVLSRFLFVLLLLPLAFPSWAKTPPSDPAGGAPKDMILGLAAGEALGCAGCWLTRCGSWTAMPWPADAHCAHVVIGNR
ncbi:MAG: hypothetical protein AB1566_15685 [Chloroflexota bacterium]